jgi:secreted trypsin-like serine protease
VRALLDASPVRHKKVLIGRKKFGEFFFRQNVCEHSTDCTCCGFLGQCGLTLGEMEDSKTRWVNPNVVGGEKVEIANIPWQVGLEIQNIFPWCGASLIGPTTVLTAAHCIDSVKYPDEIKVLYGGIDARDTSRYK